ncbi:MAG TPA: hypothetical protein VJ951_04895 [Bacteroidales bacterium]|nr:hypothetical protein [Bacteroidales bacterium]
MKRKQHIIPPRSEQPFKVPDRYFEDLEKRVMNNIHSEEGKDRSRSTDVLMEKKKVSLRPYITLAAAITGIALVTYIILQTASKSLIGENQTTYDIETLYDAGIMHDESVLAESYDEMEEDSYSEWDEDAMTYLASNELEILLALEETNEAY